MVAVSLKKGVKIGRIVDKSDPSRDPKLPKNFQV